MKQSRSDKGTYRKYANPTEKAAARLKQKREANCRYRERNRELVRERSREYREANKETCIARTVAWQRNNPDKAKNAVYRRKYGISLADYQKMCEDQDNKCDICKTQTVLVIDHCHNSLKVRGLICDRCNVGLGCFKDNEENILAAARYLKKNKEYDL